MANEREFRLPKTLLAVLAVNAGVALAAYGSCDAPAPAEPPAPVGLRAPLSTSLAYVPLEGVSPIPDQAAPLPETERPGPSQVGRDPFAGAPESPDAGWRDPCPPCGRG